MTHVLICDNNPIFADFLKQEVQRHLPVPSEITVCHTREDLRALTKQILPQIVLLDIHLDDSPENGITLAKELFPAGSGTAVIFVTGYTEYVSDVYETEHIYFIRKTIQSDYLKKALQKALQHQESRSPVFPVRSNGSTLLIDLREVLFMESFYRKIRIHMWNETIECYGAFSSLPEFVSRHMIQCHKSFLANPDYIRTMDRQHFLLRNGTSVPISRSRYNESRQAFLDYCARNMKN